MWVKNYCQLKMKLEWPLWNKKTNYKLSGLTLVKSKYGQNI